MTSLRCWIIYSWLFAMPSNFVVGQPENNTDDRVPTSIPSLQPSFLAFSSTAPSGLSNDLSTAPIDSSLVMSLAPSTFPILASLAPSSPPESTQPTSPTSPSPTLRPSGSLTTMPPSTSPPTTSPLTTMPPTTSPPTTMPPTTSPSTNPIPTPITSAPIVVIPTLAPTFAKTPTPTVMVTPPTSSQQVIGEVSIILKGLGELMPISSRSTLRKVAQVFISAGFAEVDYPLQDLQVLVLDQLLVRRQGLRRRGLEEGTNDLQVNLGVEGSIQTSQDDADDPRDVDMILVDLFDTDGHVFLENLMGAGSTADQKFFEDVTSVGSLTSYATTAPTTKPSVAPSAPTEPGSSDAIDKGDDSTFSVDEYLIYIVIAGASLFLLLLLICYYSCSKEKTSLPTDSVPVNSGSFPSDSEVGRNASEAGTHSKSKVTSPPSLHNQYSKAPSDDGNVSETSTQLYNPSVIHRLDNESHAHFGLDNASYAYSLEAGIEPSVASSGYASHDIANFLGSPSRDTALDISASGIANPNSPFRSNGSSNENMITREVAAPPGKLGIVIDTTLDGPVVHKVNPGSPLEGKVWPGDIIVAIDNIDTRAMSAASITTLMIKTANQRRKLTIVSDASK